MYSPAIRGDALANESHVWHCLWWYIETISLGFGQELYPHFKNLWGNVWLCGTQTCCDWVLWTNNLFHHFFWIETLAIPLQGSLFFPLCHLLCIGLRKTAQQKSSIFTRDGGQLHSWPWDVRYHVLNWKCHGTVVSLGFHEERCCQAFVPYPLFQPHFFGFHGTCCDSMASFFDRHCLGTQAAVTQVSWSSHLLAWLAESCRWQIHSLDWWG